MLADHRGRAGDLAGDPADRADQLGHRVPGGYRVIEHSGIQRPSRLTGQRPGLGHHHPHSIENPIGPIRGRQPPWWRRMSPDRPDGRWQKSWRLAGRRH